MYHEATWSFWVLKAPDRDLVGAGAALSACLLGLPEISALLSGWGHLGCMSWDSTGYMNKGLRLMIICIG